MSATDRRIDYIAARVSRLERALGLKADGQARWRADVAPSHSDWIICRQPDCQRLSYKQEPACLRCKGYDPRTGEGVDDEKGRPT